MDSSASIQIDRPPTDVFDFVIDIPNDAKWRTGVVEAAYTSSGPPGVGSTGYDRIDANGRQMTAEWEVFDFLAGSHARWNLVSGPIAGTGGYICEPSGGGTRFTLEAHIKPTGYLRLMGPIFGLIGRRQTRRDAAALKRILE